ncbi:MAG: diguanylate cyclase [Clostridia bacterium]
MEIMQKVFSIIEDSASAFVIGKYPEKELIYHNKVAKDVYGICNDTAMEQFYKMFEKSQLSLEVGIKTGFLDKGVVNFNDVMITKADGTDQIADISIGFSNDTKKEVYLKITPKINTNIEMILYKIEQADHAKSMFELDDDLKIFCCNKKFCDMLNAGKVNCLVQHGLHLTSIFQDEEKAELKTEILDTLSKREKFKRDVKITKQTGEKTWVNLELELIKVDENNEKIVCTLLSIDDFMKKEEEYLRNQQFLMAMQRLSNDIIYKIDMKNMTLYHSVDSQQMNLLGKVIPDYVNTMIREKLLHPEDVEKYVKRVSTFSSESIDDSEDEIYRFALINPDEYIWYRVCSEKIFDENGELIEVYGSLINIDNEQKLQKEKNLINKYFTTLQEITEEILFYIDIENKVFHHADKNALEFGVSAEIPNFVETFIENEFIHPDDAEDYREYTSKLFSGENMEYEIRSAVGVGVYEWFSVRCKFIYDDNGKPIEIFGAMENIQVKKELEQKASHDLMTNVLNKVSFETKVEEILENSNESKNHSLIFLDLDDFKGVNDTLGHSFGDFLLTTVGKRLKHVVREGDLVGRVGGDEFAVFLKSLGEKSALERAEVLLDTLRREFSFEGKSRKIKASLGISVYPNHGKNYKELIQKSDIALYVSKGKGKNIATIYNEQLVNNY